MKLTGNVGAAALALALAACGGGGESTPPTSGGGSGGGGGGSGGGGGGTPAPTYPTFAELTGNQQFRSACGGLFNLQQPIDSGGFTRYPNPPSALAHDFSAGSDTWTITGMSPDGVEFTRIFTPADVVTTTIPNTTAYRQVDGTGFPNRYFFGQQTIGTTLSTYMRATSLFVRPGSGTMALSCVIGVPTELSDRPASTVTYSEFGVIGNVFINNPGGPPSQFEISESAVRLSANPTTGLIEFELDLVGRQFQPDGSLSDTRTQFGKFGGNAGIDGTEQSFAAPLNRLPDNSVGGGYAGWFFGPQGQEVGIGITYFGAAADGSMISFSGTVSARK